MRVLGVVTARAGSKRMPAKNVALLGGKPLIAWSIEVGLATCDKVVTSTDSTYITSVARECGSDVVFCPLNLDDPSQHVAQVRHAAEVTMEATKETFEAVLLLQPTSPFRDERDVVSAIKLMEGNPHAQCVISVVEFNARNTIFVLGHDGAMLDVTEIVGAARRANTPRLFKENGAIFLVRTAHLLTGGDWYDPPPLAHVMPPERSLDIDTRADFDAAAAMLAEGGPLAHRAGAPKKLVAS